MQRIGKYQVLKVLGRGGMGTVYQALDPLINRQVAIKTMSPGFAEKPDLRARFLREARAAGGLHHRNIVIVYELGEDAGRPFIAMELIPGSDLDQLIRQGDPSLGPTEKLRILAQICAGLGYAHRSGIIHRDVKPANIRVTPEAEVKIMDFGIAHLQESTLTRDGFLLGTVHYMSPEAINEQQLDHRSDIFSVGAIAYELLTLKKPFEGDSLAAVMVKVTEGRPDMTPLSRTPYSPRLEQIVLKALATDVADRYQSLDAMQADLEALLQEGPRGSAGAPREAADLQEIEQARADGQLQRALGLSETLLERHPEAPEGRRLAEEIRVEIRERQVEELSAMALAYAADGETDLAEKIAAKIESLAPESARSRELRRYLEEERARVTAETLTASARDHLVHGNLDEALASAEEALAVDPSHAGAREIWDRVATVLESREARTASALGAEAPLPRVPGKPPPPARKDGSPATGASAPAVSGPTGSDSRHSEVEALVSQAVNLFVQNQHLAAQAAVDRALALDPGNRKALELLKILGVLG